MLLPRLDRHAASEILERHLGTELEAVTESMPDIPEVVTYAPVGGVRIENKSNALADLRSALVDIAAEHGMPGEILKRGAFEGRTARLLYEQLPMTPHEASHEEVWSYLTCVWLLDIAMWRFGSRADSKRFIGDLNRNTFRRMWWRAEILGPDIDLTLLGEDELVNIMERPTLASDRRLARAIAREFLARVERGEAPRRQDLMREASKRLLRLTPFVAFGSLADSQLDEVVATAFESAGASIEGRVAVPTTPHTAVAPRPSPEVAQITSMLAAAPGERPHEGPSEDVGFDLVAQVAVDLARSTGRVTNMTLRNVAHITSDEARDVFKQLVAEGLLVRRGEKRGTHYVLPASAADAEPEAARSDDAVPGPAPASAVARPLEPSRPSDSALRRLLRRGR